MSGLAAWSRLRGAPLAASLVVVLLATGFVPLWNRLVSRSVGKPRLNCRVRQR
jgi:hypothetical protein